MDNRHETLAKGELNLAFNGHFEFSEVEKNSREMAKDEGVRVPNQQMESSSRAALNKERFQAFKNLILISTAFMLLFTAFNSLSNIQSSYNSDAGLGLASLSTIYGALVVSCMFAPTYVIKKLGCKWTIFVAMILYIPYIIANIYPTFYTMIPTAALVGFGASLLWNAKSVYVTEIATRHSEIFGEARGGVIIKFFGIFFGIFQLGQIWGNLASSLILVPEDGNLTISESQLQICGSRYCNQPLVLSEPSGLNASLGNQTGSNMDNHKAINMNQMYLLLGIFMASAAFGALIVAVFVDPCDRNVNNDGGICHQATATFRLLGTDIRIMFLIPITIYLGIEIAFHIGVFTTAFMTCTIGIQNIGYVMIVSGIANSIGSIAFGSAAKFVGRLPLMILALLTHGSLLVTLLLWHPKPDHVAVFYILAALWGLADSIWQTQINGLFGFLFVQYEAGFSNFRLWESVGFILGFCPWSASLCVDTKIYVVMAVLVVGFIGCCVVEIFIIRERRSTSDKSVKKK